MILGEMMNFQIVNLPKTSTSHLVFELTFWQVDHFYC